MRVGVYLRQSLDPHGNLLAVDRQRMPCLEVCTEKGWEPVEYVDNNVSASSRRPRPAYEQMLADIKAGKIQGIVVWDLDRLYRQPRELEYLIELADEYRLKLVTVTGEVDLSTDGGRLFARIKGAVAKAEMERKSARQKLMHRQRAQAGISWGNRRTFGYTAEHELHPVEAPAVRRAFDLFLSGKSLGSIATGWNEQGFTTTVGNAWRGPGVRNLLANPRVAGLRAYNGEIVGPGNWKAIVPQDVWESAGVILSRPDRNPRPGSRARKYLLTGIAWCGRCAGEVTLSSGKTRRGAVLYRCNKCFGIGRSQPALDGAVIGLVSERLSRPDAADLLVDRRLVNLDELRAESATLQGRLDALSLEFADGELTASQLRLASQRLQSRLRKVETAMADAGLARVFEGVIGVDDVEAAFRGLSLDRQRTIVSALLTVSVLPTRRGSRFDPDSILVKWKS